MLPLLVQEEKVIDEIHKIIVIRSEAPFCHIISWSLFYHIIQSVPGGMAKLRESVPVVELYRYNPKHLYPKLNGYGDNGQRSMKL